ncbi:MAG: hypothetical protein PUB55_04960 [Bacteroidales bacterium]|nr:hypothetical protein [Bacteroidales bacterium]
MDKIILKQYVAKWKKAVGFLESQVSDMNAEEKAAFVALKDFWKSQYSGSMASAYKSSITTLKQSHKYHINNKPLIESSKDLCLIASAALKDKDSFYEFQDALSGGASFRPVEPPHASTNSSSRRRSASSSGSRQFGSATPSDIVVNEVRFRCTDSYGSNLSNFDTNIVSGACMVYPTIRYNISANALRSGAAITYAIYDTDGRFVQSAIPVGGTIDPARGNSGWLELNPLNISFGTFTPGANAVVVIYYLGTLISSFDITVKANPNSQQHRQRSTYRGYSPIEIQEVRFRCTDSYGSNLSNFDTYLERRATTLYPTIKYSLNNQATGPYEITYKIYDSDGRLIQVNSMVGTTLYSTDSNAGWKECSGVTMNPGIYALGSRIRIEFYYGGNIIYSANVPVLANAQQRPPQPQPRPQPHPHPQPSSSDSDSGGCLTQILTYIFWLVIFFCAFQMCN